MDQPSSEHKKRHIRELESLTFFGHDKHLAEHQAHMFPGDGGASGTSGRPSRAAAERANARIKDPGAREREAAGGAEAASPSVSKAGINKRKSPATPNKSPSNAGIGGTSTLSRTPLPAAAYRTPGSSVKPDTHTGRPGNVQNPALPEAALIPSAHSPRPGVNGAGLATAAQIGGDTQTSRPDYTRAPSLQGGGFPTSGHSPSVASGRSAEASASAATMPVARAAAEALIKAEAAGRAITHACLIKSCQLTKEVVIAP